MRHPRVGYYDIFQDYSLVPRHGTFIGTVLFSISALTMSSNRKTRVLSRLLMLFYFKSGVFENNIDYFNEVIKNYLLSTLSVNIPGKGAPTYPGVHVI